MRARVAYISSFGTTTILVAAALLILAVGGAIVAFNGWPGSASDAKVDSVSLDPAEPARSATPARSRPAAARPAARPAPARAARAAPRAATTAGLVKSTPAVGPGNAVPGLVMIRDDRPVAAPDPQPVAAPSGGGNALAAPPPGEAPRIVDPNELPYAGGLLPVDATPLPAPIAGAPDFGGVAGPGGTVDPVTMVGQVLGQLPPLPALR